MRQCLSPLLIIAAAILQTAICASAAAQNKTADSAQKSEITIIKATYGDDERALDCTDQVKKFYKEKTKTWITLGGLKIKKTFKGYYAKDLRIRYELDGVEHTAKLKHRLNYSIYRFLNREADRIRKSGPTKKDSAENDPAKKAPSKKETSVVTSVELPGRIIQVRTGGGGRYIICRLESNSNLFVVDVVLKKIVKQIPISDGVVFAASKDKLLIALPLINQLQKWDLTTLKRDKAVALGRDFVPTNAAMGCNSQGPLGLYSRGELKLWDLDSMTVRPLRNNLDYNPDWKIYLTASADGQTFCSWTYVNGQPFKLMRVAGNSASILETEAHSRGGRWAMPKPGRQHPFAVRGCCVFV